MSTITTIQSSDLVSDSRSIINTNFANLNTDKKEVGYALQAACQSFSPSDGATEYFGCFPGGAVFTTADNTRVYIPKAGTIKAIYLYFNVAGTLGSSETSTVSIRLNNTTDTTITSALTCDAVSNAFSNTSLAISVVAGDYFEIKWVTPTWATNPTTLRPSAVIYIE